MIQALPPPDELVDVRPDLSIARRQMWSRFLPTVMLRFTARSGAGGDLWIYPTVSDVLNWPVPLGITLEVRAIWGTGGFADPTFLSQGGGR